MPPALIIGGAALVGGIAGSTKDTKSSESTNESWLEMSPDSDLQKRTTREVDEDWTKVRRQVDIGPGDSDIAAGLGASRGYAGMLDDYAKTGGMPNQADWAQGTEMGKRMFDPQRQLLDQDFEDQNQQANRLAARLGRSPNDPIIQNQLRQGMMRQKSQFAADERSFGMNYAMQQPGQRLGYAGQAMDMKNQLASQAMSNRQALLQMGDSLKTGERNWQLQTARRHSRGTQTEESGGGLKGMIGGALGGASIGMGMSSMLGSGGGSPGGGGGNSMSNASSSMLGANTNLGYGGSNNMGSMGGWGSSMNPQPTRGGISRRGRGIPQYGRNSEE